MLPNGPAFAAAFYGILYAGAVAVPMNPLLKAPEIEFYLANTTAKALFAPPAFAGEASGDFHPKSTRGRFVATNGTWTVDATNSPLIDAFRKWVSASLRITSCPSGLE